ncbi:MAG: hypothetical protein HQL87_14190 [Magnetococcales bacterium]|nr:hypothetical protein [Magnetococcales bacterium]
MEEFAELGGEEQARWIKLDTENLKVKREPEQALELVLVWARQHNIREDSILVFTTGHFFPTLLTAQTQPEFPSLRS